MSRPLFIFCFSCLLLLLISKAQHRYDILISECLPDPPPFVGMPESSFIELKNRSPMIITFTTGKLTIV